MNKLSMQVEGMSCGHCVKHVERALGTVPGVSVQDVRVGSAVVAYDPAKASEEAIVGSVTQAGYPARKAGVDGATAGKASCSGGCCGGH